MKAQTVSPAGRKRRSLGTACALLSGLLALRAPAQVNNATYSNTNTITIGDGVPATPYPSVITVGNVAGVISRVTVTVTNLHHTFPDDLDLLLVSPSGQSVMLMSDVGGGHDVTNAILTFDDAATASLSDSGPIVSGTYKPTNYSPGGPETYFFAPAPPGPFGARMADLMGSLPSGDWKLFIVDDSGSDAGGIRGGWRLRFSTVDPVTAADLAVGIYDWRDPMLSDGKLVYTVSVTNRGPYEAIGVTLTDVLPPDVNFLFAEPSQGSCSFTNGVVVCSLDDMALDSVATVVIGALPARTGTVTNVVSVTASNPDFQPANSTAVETTAIVPAEAADLVVRVTDAPSPVVLGQSLTYTCLVTNQGPLAATGILFTDHLPPDATLLSLDASQGSCSHAGSLVVCDLGALSNQASATITLVVRPNASGYLTNVATAVANEFDTTPDDATTVSATLVYIPTDLSVGQTDSKDPASLGSNLTYTVTIFNNGPGGATGVTLSNLLPVSATLVAMTPSQGSCQVRSGGLVWCNLGNLAPSAGAQVAITVRPQVLGKYFNIATVFANEVDSDFSNNISTEDTTVFPGGNGIVITPSTNALELANAITAAGSTGIRVTRANLQAHAGSNYVFVGTNFILVPAFSSGLYSALNAPFTYGLQGLGVVISSGNVQDYETGPSSSSGNTATFGVQATTNQEALLDPITSTTNRTFTHYDVTQLDVEFDLLPGFDSVLFNVVFGSEEYPEFVNSSFIDGFGIYLNGVNIAYARGRPVNINHPDMRAVSGTELDGILAPGGNPIVSFSKFIGSGSTNNRLTFIVSDTSDSVLDTTVFVSSLQGTLPPNADLAIGLTGPTNSVTVGSNFTYRVTLTNRGPDLATGTVLSNVLPAGVAFVSAVPSQGSCAYADGVVICDLFSVDRGYTAAVTITATATVEGFLTNSAWLSSSLKDFGPTNNAATCVSLAVNYGSFVSIEAIAVNDGAPATPYPAALAVSGISGVITQTTVTLKRLTHDFPADLDVLLVSPWGQAVMLMSDAGANRALTNVTLSFSDQAAAPLPRNGTIISGSYRPSNYDPPDAFWPPAPSGPYGTVLEAFNGASPVGTWSLFICDDMGQDAGLIFGGWSLSFGLDVQTVPVRLSVQCVGTQLVLSWPAAATDYVLQSTAALSSVPVWNTVTNSVVQAGGRCWVTVELSGRAGYYRLWKTVP